MKHLRSTGVLFILVALVAGYAYFIEYKGKIQEKEAEIQAKKLIPFSLEEITGFSVKSNGKEFVFEKKETQDSTKWFIVKPVNDVANYAAVQGFLSQFGQESYEDVVAEGLNVDFAIYGLNDQENSTQKINEVNFTRKTGDTEQTLIIEVGTATATAGKKYLRINKQDKVLLAGYFWESQLQKNLKDLREKKFVPPDFSVSKIEIKNPVSDLTFYQQDGKWTLKELSTNDSDQVAIDDIYYQIKNLRASQIFKEGKSEQDLFNLGLTKPEIQIKIYEGPSSDNESKSFEIAFSKNMAGQVYAISNLRDVIFSLSPSGVGVFKKTVEDFRDKKKPLSFDLATVEQIDYRSDFASFKLKKDEGAWKSIENLDGKVIDSSKVTDILNKLSKMKVEKYFDSEVLHQKSGMIELKLKNSTGNEVLDLEWSPRPVDDVFVAKSNLTEKTFGLSLQDIGSLPFQAVVVDSSEKPKLEAGSASQKDIE